MVKEAIGGDIEPRIYYELLRFDVVPFHGAAHDSSYASGLGEGAKFGKCLERAVAAGSRASRPRLFLRISNNLLEHERIYSRDFAYAIEQRPIQKSVNLPLMPSPILICKRTLTHCFCTLRLVPTVVIGFLFTNCGS